MSVTEPCDCPCSPVAKNHLSPTWNLCFPYVIIPIHDFFSFNSEFFLQKKILRLTKMIQTCAKTLHYFDSNDLHFLKCGNIFFHTLRKKW